MPDHLHRTLRPAHRNDGPRFFEIRRQAILVAGSPLVARQWADVTHLGGSSKSSPIGGSGCSRCPQDFLVGERRRRRGGRAIHAARLLSARHRFRPLGVRRRATPGLGFSAIVLNASINAESFYRSRGYLPDGDRHAADSPDHGSLPMRKAFSGKGHMRLTTDATGRRRLDARDLLLKSREGICDCVRRSGKLLRRYKRPTQDPRSAARARERAPGRMGCPGHLDQSFRLVSPPPVADRSRMKLGQFRPISGKFQVRECRTREVPGR
jgi:hypothetical protein